VLPVHTFLPSFYATKGLLQLNLGGFYIKTFDLLKFWPNLTDTLHAARIQVEDLPTNVMHRPTHSTWH
jgi:hypothetical protein